MSAPVVCALVVLGATPGVRRLLTEAGIRYIGCESGEEAVEILDDDPTVVLAYGPGVFGRAMSGRSVRIEPAEDAEPFRSVMLVDGLPPDLPPGQVDDDPRRLAWRARVPLRVSTYVDLTVPEQVEALRGFLDTL